MKKILVLMLVLGIASMATAGLTITAPATVEAGEAFTVIVNGLVSDIPAGDGVYGSLGTGGLPDDDGLYVLLPDVGDSVMQWDYFTTYGTYDFKVGAGIVDITVDGAWLQLDLVAGAVGEIYNMSLLKIDFVTEWDSSSTEVIIPEPMTLALLGIGGLFLRRRK